MLRHILRHVRRQSRATRESYAFGFAVLVTSCIALLWATQLADRLTVIGSINIPDLPAVEDVQSTEQASNPFPFSNFFSRMQASVRNFSNNEQANELIDTSDNWRIKAE